MITEKQKREATEKAVHTLLRVRNIDKGRIRFIAGNCAALTAQKARSAKLLPDIEDGRVFTREERHVFQHSYSRGYLEGVQATIEAICGESAYKAFINWTQGED